MCVHTCVCARTLSCVGLFATSWTITHQAPLSMEFSRQEYRSGLPFPSPGDLHDPGIKPVSPALAGRFFTTVSPGKEHKDNKVFLAFGWNTCTESCLWMIIYFPLLFRVLEGFWRAVTDDIVDFCCIFFNEHLSFIFSFAADLLNFGQ